jgi:predicted DNA-binding transcriptional regulator AlpA
MADQVPTEELRGWLGRDGGRVPDDREDRLLPWPSVRQIAGISRTTAWRLQQTGEFPRPVPISANRVGWWESDLTAWKAKRRFAGGERPRPYGQSALIRDRPQIPRVAVKSSPPPGRADPKPELRSPGAPPRRQSRTRAVSPDQIDFGF